MRERLLPKPGARLKGSSTQSHDSAFNKVLHEVFFNPGLYLSLGGGVHRGAGRAAARNSGSQPHAALAASLGLTFSYNATVGIPIYLEVAKFVTRSLPVA